MTVAPNKWQSLRRLSEGIMRNYSRGDPPFICNKGKAQRYWSVVKVASWIIQNSKKVPGQDNLRLCAFYIIVIIYNVFQYGKYDESLLYYVQKDNHLETINMCFSE